MLTSSDFIWPSPSGPPLSFQIWEAQPRENRVAAIGFLTMKKVESWTCLRRRRNLETFLGLIFFGEAFSENFLKLFILYRIPFDFRSIWFRLRNQAFACWSQNQRKSYTKINASEKFREILPKKISVLEKSLIFSYASDKFMSRLFS